MPTKCTILGKHPKQTIEFVWLIAAKKKVKAASWPDEFENIELVCLNYDESGYDLMFAYDRLRNDGLLFLGYWNDGTTKI